jgi:hypothetical protein
LISKLKAGGVGHSHLKGQAGPGTRFNLSLQLALRKGLAKLKWA